MPKNKLAVIVILLVSLSSSSWAGGGGCDPGENCSAPPIDLQVACKVVQVEAGQVPEVQHASFSWATAVAKQVLSVKTWYLGGGFYGEKERAIYSAGDSLSSGGKVYGYFSMWSLTGSEIRMNPLEISATRLYRTVTANISPRDLPVIHYAFFTLEKAAEGEFVDFSLSFSVVKGFGEQESEFVAARGQMFCR